MSLAARNPELETAAIVIRGFPAIGIPVQGPGMTGCYVAVATSTEN